MVLILCAAVPLGVAAHFCSNIFVAHSKIVVQPEKSSVTVGSGPASLRVYLQNNFPFKIRYTEMRGVASGYTITVSPGPTDIFPGQKVGYLFSISGPAGTLPTTTMTIQVQFRDNRWNSFPPERGERAGGPWTTTCSTRARASPICPRAISITGATPTP